MHNTNYDITMKLHGTVQTDYYDKKTLDYAIKHPVFQHFCVGSGDFAHRPWLNPYHENRELYEEYFNKSSFDEKDVFFFKEVPLIARMNRILARNRVTSFLIVKLIPDSICEKIVGRTDNIEKKDVERW